MSLNNWKMIAETRSYIFRWRSCFRQRRVELKLPVTPMRLPKRNTLTFTVTVRSILKRIGSNKIDISIQNRSDQLFEFQTEERIFPSWCRTNINKPPLCYHRRDLCCLDPQAFKIAAPFSADNSETEIDLFIPQVFPKKFTQRKQRWTTKIPFHARD